MAGIRGQHRRQVVHGFEDDMRADRTQRLSSIFASAPPADAIRRRYLPDWKERDLHRACYSLRTAGYLDFIPLDNQPDEISLTDAAVIYSEQRFLRALSSVQSAVETGVKLAQVIRLDSGN